MKVFNNPHFHASQKSSSKASSLQSSRVGGQSNRIPDGSIMHSQSQEMENGHQTDFNAVLGKLNALQVEEDQFDLYCEMSKLKARVLSLLKKYQILLQGSQAKTVKNQIKSDVEEILLDYQSIIDQYQVDQSQLEIENKIPSLQKEKDLNLMFNLVEEFLERFSHRKATMNYFSLLQQEKMHRNGLGLFAMEQDGRQSMYDFQAEIPDLSDSNNSEGNEISQQARMALSNSQKLRGQIRRRFFDLAMKVKEKLPLYHSGRKQLISILFEDAEEEGVEEAEWEDWIMAQLTKE